SNEAASARRRAKTGSASRTSSEPPAGFRTTTKKNNRPARDPRRRISRSARGLRGCQAAAIRSRFFRTLRCRATFLILRRNVGAFLDEHLRDLVDAFVAGLDERRVAEVVVLIRIGAGLEHHHDELTASCKHRSLQRRAALHVLAVELRSMLEQPCGDGRVSVAC